MPDGAACWRRRDRRRRPRPRGSASTVPGSGPRKEAFVGSDVSRPSWDLSFSVLGRPFLATIHSPGDLPKADLQPCDEPGASVRGAGIGEGEAAPLPVLSGNG